MKKLLLFFALGAVNCIHAPIKSMDYLGDAALSLYFAQGTARLYDSIRVCSEVDKLANLVAHISPSDVIGNGLFLEPLKNPQLGISKITLGLGLAAFLSLRTLKTAFPSNPDQPNHLNEFLRIFGPALLLAGGFCANLNGMVFEPHAKFSLFNPVQIAVRLCEKYPDMSPEKLHALVSYIQNNSGNLLNQRTMLLHGGLVHMLKLIPVSLGVIDLQREDSLLRRASGFIAQAAPRFTGGSFLKYFKRGALDQRGVGAQPGQPQMTYVFYEHINGLIQTIIDSRDEERDLRHRYARGLDAAITQDLLYSVDRFLAAKLLWIKRQCRNLHANDRSHNALRRFLNSEELEIAPFLSDLIPGENEGQQERRASRIHCHKCTQEIGLGETYYCCNLCFRLSHEQCKKYLQTCNVRSCNGSMYTIDENPLSRFFGGSRSVDELKVKHPPLCSMCNTDIGKTFFKNPKVCLDCKRYFCMWCGFMRSQCNRCYNKLK